MEEEEQERALLLDQVAAQSGVQPVAAVREAVRRLMCVLLQIREGPPDQRL